MRITYHIGLHSTDEDRALRCLLRNADALSAQGSVVTVPGRFRPVLREAMIALKGAPAPEAMQEDILDAVMDEDVADHLLFSNDSFLCVPMRAVQNGTLYPLASERLPWIRNLFPDHPAHFVFALRNPATWLPAIQRRFAKEQSFEDFIARINPEDLAWSDVIARAQAALPDCDITVWCNEDSPLIWPEILQVLSAHPEGMQLKGQYDFLGMLMNSAGLKRMKEYLRDNPPKSALHRRKITAAFLDKFALPGAVEEEFDLPGWTPDRVAFLTSRYEAEVAKISAMPGVRVLSA